MARRTDAEFNRDERLAIDLLARLLSTPQGRKFAIILALVAIIAFAGWWTAHRWHHHPTATGPTIRIATWNMHVFASRPAIRLDTIARIIRESKFDIIAMQEIRENGEEVDALLGVLGSPWKRSNFSRITGNHERFVFLYDSDHVEEIGSAHLISYANAFAFNRIPFEDTFRAGQFDFTLVTCHLYYGEGTAGHERRRRETQMLADYAKEQVASAKGKDVICLGDFNETVGRENLHYFTSFGWSELNHDPTNLHSTEIYDNILIDKRHTTEYAGTAGSVHFDERLFNRNDKEAVEAVSDHRPAYADFVTTMADRD
jgi:endonuclease/exonuclease/phosphatase family metal-dependent hydrolase